MDGSFELIISCNALPAVPAGIRDVTLRRDSLELCRANASRTIPGFLAIKSRRFLVAASAGSSPIPRPRSLANAMETAAPLMDSARSLSVSPPGTFLKASRIIFKNATLRVTAAKPTNARSAPPIFERMPPFIIPLALPKIFRDGTALEIIALRAAFRSLGETSGLLASFSNSLYDLPFKLSDDFPSFSAKAIISLVKSSNSLSS